MKYGHETGMVSSEGMLWWVSYLYWKTKKIVHKHCLKKQEWSLLRVFFVEEFVYLEIHGDLFIKCCLEMGLVSSFFFSFF